MRREIIAILIIAAVWAGLFVIVKAPARAACEAPGACEAPVELGKVLGSLEANLESLGAAVDRLGEQVTLLEEEISEIEPGQLTWPQP